MTLQVNTQPIEKRERSYEGTLSVHSIFYTIQGEGPFCGTPAVFIRLAGCNLQCPGCDTEYTQGRQDMGPYNILATVNELARADRFKRALVVITGGEPFRQHIGELLSVLVQHGYYIQVESNGSFNPPIMADGAASGWNHNTLERQGFYLVISPKTGKINPLALDASCALKYVGEHGDLGADDGLPNHALRHTANPRLARPPHGYSRPIYLQPMDGKDDDHNRRNLDAIVQSCMKHDYILQLQIHKLLGVE